jgi:hypothetical protein
MTDTPEKEDGKPARYWNFRVMEFSHGEDTWRAIHEVHYEHNVPVSYSQNEAIVMWAPEEGEAAGLNVLERMREAIAKPVLRVTDFEGNAGSGETD